MRAAVVVLCCVVLLTGCSGDKGTGEEPTTTAADQQSITTTIPVDERALWQDLLEDLPMDASSGVIGDGDERWGVTAFAEVATIWSFDGETWGRSSTIELELPAFASATGASEVIEVGELTGDGIDDAVVQLLGNGAFGTVISNHTGQWQAVVFAADGYESAPMEDLRVQGRDLVTYERLCVPDCATGGIDEVLWGYDESANRFVETARTVVVPTTAVPVLTPGAPCALGSHHDCIDPDQSGEGVYLIGGGDCVAALGPDTGLCSDLDGDGYAGYPDSG